MPVQKEGLNQHTINSAFKVPAYGQPVSRSLINGAIVIHDIDNPPAWLQPILSMRDENGDVQTTVIDSSETHETVEYSMNPLADPRKDNSGNRKSV